MGVARSSSIAALHQPPAHRSRVSFRSTLQVNASGQGIQPLITAQITAQLSYLVTNQFKPSFKPQPQSTAPRHHRLVREGRRSGTRATQPQPQPRLAPGAGSRRLVEPTQFSGQNDHPRAPPGGFCWRGQSPVSCQAAGLGSAQRRDAEPQNRAMAAILASFSCSRPSNSSIWSRPSFTRLANTNSRPSSAKAKRPSIV